MSRPLEALHLAFHSLSKKVWLRFVCCRREAYWRSRDQLASISGGCFVSHSNHLSSDERIATPGGRLLEGPISANSWMASKQKSKSDCE